MDDILLMLPGPTTVHPRVLNAMSQAVVNHRSKRYGEILTETNELMSKMFQTENQSYLITGSGTAVMEAGISNVLNAGEKVLNVVGGKFGERFKKIADAHGIETQELAVEWGTAVTPEQIKEALDADESIKAVSVVHNETSTGVAAPIKEIGKVMKNYDALYIVDTVSSLCGDEVDVVMAQRLGIGSGDDGVLRNVIEISRFQLQSGGTQRHQSFSAFDVINAVMFPNINDVFPKSSHAGKIGFLQIESDAAYKFR